MNRKNKNRTDLERIKSIFIENIHINGEEEEFFLIEEIDNRFKRILESLSALDSTISSDDLLLKVMKEHFGTFIEESPIQSIESRLAKEDSISFIKLFTMSLSDSC